VLLVLPLQAGAALERRVDKFRVSRTHSVHTLPQQIAHVADVPVQVGGDSAHIADASLLVDNHNAVVLAKRREPVRPVQLTAQSHVLQQTQRPLECTAAPPVALVSQQVGFDRHSRDGLSQLVADGKHLAHDGHIANESALCSPPSLMARQ